MKTYPAKYHIEVDIVDPANTLDLPACAITQDLDANLRAMNRRLISDYIDINGTGIIEAEYDRISELIGHVFDTDPCQEAIKGNCQQRCAISIVQSFDLEGIKEFIRQIPELTEETIDRLNAQYRACANQRYSVEKIDIVQIIQDGVHVPSEIPSKPQRRKAS